LTFILLITIVDAIFKATLYLLAYILWLLGDSKSVRDFEDSSISFALIFIYGISMIFILATISLFILSDIKQLQV